MNQTLTNLNSVSAKEKRFDWPLCYEAENFILDQIKTFLERNHFAHQLAERMRRETGTLLLDWIDHLVVSPPDEVRLRELGFADDPLGDTPPNQRAFWHPESMLPRIVIDKTAVAAGFPAAVAIRAESLTDFMAAHSVSGEPEGETLSRF